jgi:hypothetical protein
MSKYPLHLCQPDNTKSCGACCGLYNFEDHSRETLTALLHQRTELFFSSGEKPAPAAYQNKAWAIPTPPKLCETIHNCEFLGFVDKEAKRVGCMLHPVLHQGRDLRACSFYGAELCDNHFCISYSSLAPVEQKAVICSLDDWYLYGLVLTDIDFVKSFFSHVQNRMGDSVKSKKLDNDKVQNILRNYFELKETWEFSSNDSRLGKYYFSQAEYRIARIEYEKHLHMRPSRFDTIFVSLASGFKREGEVLAAESEIDEKIKRFIEVYG